MTNDEVLELLGGQAAMREYLRGVEEGSETDKDARRAMLAAISSARAAGVYPAMAVAEPELYAQYCLMQCRMWTDAEDAAADAIMRQHSAFCLQLRHDPRNVSDE